MFQSANAGNRRAREAIIERFLPLARHLARRYYYRDSCWSVHVPRDVHDLAMRLKRLDAQFVAEAGQRPTIAELAELAGVGVEDALEAREAYRALHSASLDEPRESDEDGDGFPLETLGSPA